MNKKYEIVWETPHRNILRINFREHSTWNDILEANVLALKMIDAEPQNVVLLNDSHGFTVDKVSIGAIIDQLFNYLPKSPKNLKGVVILAPTSQKMMLEMGIETVANTRYGRKFMQVVDSYPMAESLIQQKLNG